MSEPNSVIGKKTIMMKFRVYLFSRSTALPGFISSIAIFSILWLVMVFYNSAYNLAELNYAISFQNEGLGSMLRWLWIIVGLTACLGSIDLCFTKRVWPTVTIMMALLFSINLLLLKHNARTGHALMLHRMSDWLASEEIAGYPVEMRDIERIRFQSYSDRWSEVESEDWREFVQGR